MSSDRTSRDQFLHDLFVAALEGGIGYWSAAEEYKWSTGDGSTPDLKGFKAVVVETEDAGDGPSNTVHTIDRKVLSHGLTLLADGKCTFGGREMNPKLVARFTGLSRTNGDTLDWDAEDADMVVQAGLFGDIVYG